MCADDEEEEEDEEEEDGDEGHQGGAGELEDDDDEDDEDDEDVEDEHEDEDEDDEDEVLTVWHSGTLLVRMSCLLGVLLCCHGVLCNLLGLAVAFKYSAVVLASNWPVSLFTHFACIG